ncbi:MAG: menaquinone biosynthesis decarboxylase [Turicibacter sp.]|nr:menaquinone biosynthesis decarboxylase [Turicibacter sp.]
MAYKDLQHFMKKLERSGELFRVKARVSAKLEITEITDRISKRNGPALLFENVANSEFPVLINIFGSYRRMSMALGAKSLEAIEHDIGALINMSNYMKFTGLLKQTAQVPRLAGLLPVKIKKAAAQEVVEEPDLRRLPILKCWPGDGGRFITMPLVFTRDPETGQQNVGMYRMQVFDKKTTGMHWHKHKDGNEIYEKYRAKGLSMPISVAIGADPATIYAATAPLPKIVNEIMFAGYLRKFPVPMVKSVTNEIYVPANSEFVLEGFVDTTEPLRKEGPFGDHTGYYSEVDDYPVFHLTKITRKRNPVYNATIVGKPPMEDCYMGKATERLFLPLLKMIAPEIRDVSFPLEGVFHNCVIVSIDKRFPAHAKKVMNTIWGQGQMMYTKMIIVVDKDINPHDYSTVAWKVFNNIDAKRDVVISEGPLDALDHSSPMRLMGHRMGIDATKKWQSEGYDRDWPDDIAMSEEVVKMVDARWKSYGFKN